MLTTTEFRSHWIDTATGARHMKRWPGLQPVINLDEVRGWLSIATSNEMLYRGFPGGPNDAAVFYMRALIERPESLSEHQHAQACIELIEDVPRYHQRPDCDWRTPFLENQSRWPAPPASPSTILNLTPHTIHVSEFAIPPSGAIARATEEATQADPIVVSIPDPTGAPADRIDYRVPTSTVRYTGTVDLPEPRHDVFLVVSTITAQAAAAAGRDVFDLLVPGEPIRDSAGRVVGCRSLTRVAKP